MTDDGAITLEALPRSPDGRGADVTVGVVEGGPMLIEGFERLEAAVRRKRRQHRAVSDALVVALDLSEGLTHDDEVAAALYGPVVLHASAAPPYEARDRSRGIWPTGADSKSPAGVLIIDRLGLGQAEHARVVQWSRPGDAPVLGDGPWEQASLVGDRVRSAAAAEPVEDALARAGVR